MGPVRQNPIPRTVRSVHVCALHCAQLLHRTDLIIFPLTLQTITIAPMMSISGKGESLWSNCRVWTLKYLLTANFRHEGIRPMLRLLRAQLALAKTHQPFINSYETRMWVNAQRDGRPAEYRWRPLFNAAKLGWRPPLERCAAKPVEICRGARNSPTDLSR